MRFRFRLLLAVLLSFSPATLCAPPRTAGASAETLLVAIELERKARVQDIRDLERLGRELETLEREAAGRRSQLNALLERPDVEAGLLVEAEEDLSQTEARLRALQDSRRLTAARVIEKSRKISLLGDELKKRKTGEALFPDPISGRWGVLINPMNRKGEMRLVLDGTLVYGDYILDGGFRGSLRGTFVGDKLSLQRIDSERGFDANFYGRVNVSQRKLAGTWEGTQIVPATGPSAGTWTAGQILESEEDVSITNPR